MNSSQGNQQPISATSPQNLPDASTEPSPSEVKEEPTRADSTSGAKPEAKPSKPAAEEDFFNSKPLSLQDNFDRFRKAKKQDLKYRKYVSDQGRKGRKDPNFKKRLREKFVETAKKYFGVPYAPRYWKEGEEHHNAPLYLDCCALVRQVMYDLREEFGFQLDHWNQAYQFDTLPKVITLEEVQPGDLVFLSGIYYNPKMRKQKHNMVHVEIFTGKGEQVIGARWQRGVVQYFDTFRFTSTSYHSIECHYRSIDTWLEGICKSHCPEHSWTSRDAQWAPGKKSIFSIEDDYDEADMNAPDLEEDMRPEEDSSEPATADTKSSKLSAHVSPSAKNNVFIGQGNNRELAKDSLLMRGFRSLPRGMLFSNDFRVKWTQTSMEINYMHFKEGIHLANHISNAVKVLTSKIATLQVLDSLRFNLQEGIVKSKLFKSSAEFFPETYRLDVVADLIAFLNSPTQGLWLEKKSQSNMGRGVRMIKDIAQYREELLIRKDVDSYGKLEDGAVADSTEILLDKIEKIDGAQQLESGKLQGVLDPSGGAKPEESKEEAKGEEAKGEEAKQEEQKQEPGSSVVEAKATASTAPKPKKWKNLNNLVKQLGGLVVQKYMETPSLVKGRKYDIRYYMLIACTKPYLVLTNPGYVRLSLEPYRVDGFGDDNDSVSRCVHLTNAAIQKKHPRYKEEKESTIMSMDQLRDHLLEAHPDKLGSPEEFQSKVIRRIDEVCRLLFESAKDKLEEKFGCFELFGLDLMLDEDLHPHLIEINTNPALFTDTEVQKALLPKLVDDTVKLALRLHPLGKKNGEAEVQEFLEAADKDLTLPYNVIYPQQEQL